MILITVMEFNGHCNCAAGGLQQLKLKQLELKGHSRTIVTVVVQCYFLSFGRKQATYIIDVNEVIECSMKNILHHNTIVTNLKYYCK